MVCVEYEELPYNNVVKDVGNSGRFMPRRPAFRNMFSWLGHAKAPRNFESCIHCCCLTLMEVNPFIACRQLVAMHFAVYR